MLEINQDAKWVGQSLGRVGGEDRVTGRQKFAADLRIDNSLQVKFVTIDCARARIIAIHTEAAAAVEGVRCILTAADLPQPVPKCGPAYDDRPVIAVGETRFHGEPVVAVAAETEDAAERAASDRSSLPADSVLSLRAKSRLESSLGWCWAHISIGLPPRITEASEPAGSSSRIFWM